MRIKLFLLAIIVAFSVLLVLMGVNNYHTNQNLTKQVQEMTNSASTLQENSPGNNAESKAEAEIPSNNLSTPNETITPQSMQSTCDEIMKSKFTVAWNLQLTEENARYQQAVDSFLSTKPDPSTKALVLRTLFDEHSSSVAAINSNYYEKLISTKCPLE